MKFSIFNQSPEDPNAKKNNDIIDEGRRKFLKGAVSAGILGAVAGTLGTQEYFKIKEENKMLEVYDVNNKERVEDFFYANQAANLLLSEIKLANMHRVSFTSTQGPRIDILRNFLLAHLHSKQAELYQGLHTAILTRDKEFSLDNLNALSQASFTINQNPPALRPALREKGTSKNL